jgi:hypothetical protein
LIALNHRKFVEGYFELKSLFFADLLSFFKNKRSEFHSETSFFTFYLLAYFRNVLVTDDLVVNKLVAIQDLENALLVLWELVSNKYDAVLDHGFLLCRCAFNSLLCFLSASLGFGLTQSDDRLYFLQVAEHSCDLRITCLCSCCRPALVDQKISWRSRKVLTRFQSRH